ncbi:MAG: hypothetical protein AAF388_01840 [Bacteroidota bacterium]
MRISNYYFSLVLLAIGSCWILSGCAGSKKAMDVNGISSSQIGDLMPAKGLTEWKGYSTRDTLFSEGDFSWRGLYLSYPEGYVLLEEDFSQAGMPAQGFINRIRIETPQEKVLNSLQVGMSVRELKSFASKWYVLYLEDYEMVDISSEQLTGLHFLVPAEHLLTQDHASLKMKHINKEAKIVSIVIM